MGFISISKQLNDTIQLFSVCFVLFFLSIYLNSASKHEEAHYKFNESSFHSVRINVEI